jgi:hypothetical protein
MGPMSRSRVISLVALLAVIFALVIGLSHVGQAQVIGTCDSRTWAVVIGHSADVHMIPVINQRAGKLVGADCYGQQQDPSGGWNAISSFNSQSDAQTFSQALVKAGWTRTYGFQPVVESTR